MDIAKLQEYQRSFVALRDWDQFHSPKNLSMGLAAEAAELTEVFLWLTEEQSRRVMTTDKAEAVRHELADVLFYLVRIADKLGVDLEAAFWEKTKLNEQRYPPELSRGNAKKYTDL